MNRALKNIDRVTLDKIHQYSLDILKETGIRFASEKALTVFKHHGIRVDGDMVYFGEKDIQIALDGVPALFTLESRNTSRSIQIGGSSYVMAPGYGPPFIIEAGGAKRDANRADVETFCKLVQTSKYLDFNSAIVVVAFTSAKELFPLDIAGTSVGLANLFPFLGGAVAPPILGAILEVQERSQTGYSVQAYSKAFLLYVLFALIALVAASFLTETMKKTSD